MKTMSSVADVLYATGFWLLEQSRAADARHVFRTLLTTAPDDERGWLGLGSCHERLDEPTKAAHLYALGAIARPTSARLRLASARVLQTLGFDDEAATSYELAYELAITHEDASFAHDIDRERRAR